MEPGSPLQVLGALAGWAMGIPGKEWEAPAHLTLPPPPTSELLQPRCAGGPGVLSEQQVLGGLSWQEVRARQQGWRSRWGSSLGSPGPWLLADSHFPGT